MLVQKNGRQSQQRSSSTNVPQNVSSAGPQRYISEKVWTLLAEVWDVFTLTTTMALRLHRTAQLSRYSLYLCNLLSPSDQLGKALWLFSLELVADDFP